MKFNAQQIAAVLGGIVEGDAHVEVSEFAKIEEAKTGSLTFLANAKYTHYIYETEASVVLVNEDIEFEKAISSTLVRVPNAYEALAKLMQMQEQAKPQKKGISPRASIVDTATVGDDCYVADCAYVGDNAVLGDNVQIYPNVYIGDNVKIGDNTIIYANASVYQGCEIGAACILHCGSVIGSDGFGFAPREGADYEKIPQIGNVVLEDNVEIGANTTVDRATMGSTIIRRGVKLDNLIQVAHNVEIGAHTVIAAQTGISGSTKLGARMMVGGQVGFVGHISVADGVVLGAKTVVTNTVKEENAVLCGYPVTDMSTWRKTAVISRNLPDMQRTINRLEKELKALKENLK